MLWYFRNLSILVLLAVVSCISCATWEKLKSNVPDYSGADQGSDYAGIKEEGLSAGRTLDQIKLRFYRKTDRRPLSVSERQLIHEANSGGGLKKKLTVWEGVAKEPLQGLSVQLLSESAVVATKNTDAQGAVVFRMGEDYFDYKPGMYEVHYDLLSHAPSYEIRNPYQETTLELPERTEGQIQIDVLVDWDGTGLMRVDR